MKEPRGRRKRFNEWGKRTQWWMTSFICVFETLDTSFLKAEHPGLEEGFSLSLSLSVSLPTISFTQVLAYTSGRSASSIYNVMSLFPSHREFNLPQLHTYHKAANIVISAHAKLTPPFLSYTTSSVPRGSAQSQQIKPERNSPFTPKHGKTDSWTLNCSLV